MGSTILRFLGMGAALYLAVLLLYVAFRLVVTRGGRERENPFPLDDDEQPPIRFGPAPNFRDRLARGTRRHVWGRARRDDAG